MGWFSDVVDFVEDTVSTAGGWASDVYTGRFITGAVDTALKTVGVEGDFTENIRQDIITGFDSVSGDMGSKAVNATKIYENIGDSQAMWQSTKDGAVVMAATAAALGTAGGSAATSTTAATSASFASVATGAAVGLTTGSITDNLINGNFEEAFGQFAQNMGMGDVYQDGKEVYDNFFPDKPQQKGPAFAITNAPFFDPGRAQVMGINPKNLVIPAALLGTGLFLVLKKKRKK